MGKKWRRVASPLKWEPAVGEAMEGVYLYTEVYKGPFGECKSHVVQSGGEFRYVTGVVIDSLLRPVRPGTVVRIVYEGTSKTVAGNDMKKYELYIKDDTTPEAADDDPGVEGEGGRDHLSL